MYNASPYIEWCLKSVFDQDIDHDKIEIIIINDGSPDNSQPLAESFSKGRKNVKILSQENKGLGGARNTGIDNASGKYIIFLDADDYLEYNCLSRAYEKIRKKQFQNVDVFELSCNMVSEQKIILTTIVPDHIGEIYNGMEYYLNVKNISSACNKLYRRKSLGLLRFKERIYVEDSEFNTRAFFFFKRVCALDIVLSNFVQTSGSITRNRNKETKIKLLQDTLAVLKSFKEFEKQHSSNTRTENEYFNKKYTLYAVTIFNLLVKYNMTVSEAKKIKKELKHQNLYILEYKGLERKKDLFRVFLKYSFPSYLLALGLRNRIS